jgi:hypothetical protein
MPLCGGDGYGSGNAMVYTSESDAHLIAAAPELLARLKQATETIDEFLAGIWDGNEEGWRLTIAKNQAAIAKAEGRE